MRLFGLTFVLILATTQISFVQPGQIFTGTSDLESYGRLAKISDFDGSGFVFCRAYYENSRLDPIVRGWYIDYPGMDFNLMVRLSELTNLKVKKDKEGKPVHVVVQLDDPKLFLCPMLFMSDVGANGFKESEILNLRRYLEKGGMLWADDFWGFECWDHWETEIRKVLPSAFYPMVDIGSEHPIMNQVFRVKEIPQIPNIGLWYGWYRPRGTSELGRDSEDVHFRGIKNEDGRLVVVMTHNTDIGESLEWDGKDSNREFFYKFSHDGYAIAINIVMYALLH